MRQPAQHMLQAYKAYKLGGKVSELLYSPALYGVDLSAQNMPKPRARSSPMMAVVGNTLWLFGGTVEVSTPVQHDCNDHWQCCFFVSESHINGAEVHRNALLGCR